MRVAVSEDGAELSVDGRSVGTSPLARSIHITPGKHHVDAKRRGFFPEARDIQVFAARETEVWIALRPQSWLCVTVDQADAAIVVDGAEVGRAPLAAPIAAEPGGHRVEARKDGFTPKAWDAMVAAGQTATVASRWRHGRCARPARTRPALAPTERQRSAPARPTAQPTVPAGARP